MTGEKPNVIAFPNAEEGDARRRAAETYSMAAQRDLLIEELVFTAIDGASEGFSAIALLEAALERVQLLDGQPVPPGFGGAA